jgi:DNA mismatch repair ATPase MutS
MEVFMSKLINIYNQLKQQDNETLYLFKSGIFYIFLDEDAKKISKEINLKLTNLNDNFVKCGFPATAIDKYFNLLNSTSYKIKIIDNINNLSFDFKNFVINESVQDLITKIKTVDINNLSVSEAYAFIEDLKKLVINL